MRSPTPGSRRHCLSECQGFALTITLIIVAVATIVVVAFLTTTSTERTTAAAYGRLAKARQMADAGVDAAIGRLVTEMRYRPYHAIGYRTVTVGSFGTPPTPLTELIPVITGPRTTTPATIATYNSAPVATEDVYLVSSPDNSAIPGSSPPTNLTTDNSVDINANHLASEPQGWIGSPTTAATPLPFRAPWVDVLSDTTKALQADPTQAGYNPVIGRYAYWVEDETSKLDIYLAGNQDSGGGFRHGEGANRPDATPTRLAVNDLDIGALPLIGGSPLPAGDVSTNQGLLNFRSGVPMLDARFLNRIGGQVSPDVYETAKFYSTAFSLSNDLAGNGRRRANLNALVTNQLNAATSVPSAKIAANIDDIIYVITGKHLANSGLLPAPATGDRVFEAAPDNFANTLVNFGSRFFTSPTPTAAQQTRYMERIAANIRDYIDTDSQPTIIDASGPTVHSTAIPTHPVVATGGGTAGTNDADAVGKERVPFAQEYVLRVRQIAFAPRLGAVANYSISIDHYVEFWNLSNRDINVSDLGPNPFLLIANQPGWDAGGLDDIPSNPSRDLVIPLSSAKKVSDNSPLTSFPAGAVTVITTDPVPLSTLAPDSTRIFSAPIAGSKRTYSGRTQKKSGSELRINLKTRTTTTSDYETEIALGNDFGLLESAWGAGAITATISINADLSPPENHFDDTHFHFRGASLRGNTATSPLATTGDPRTNVEQLNFDLNGSTAGNDKTRYFDNGLDSTHVPGNSTLTAPNSNFVRPANWPDPSTSTQSASGAPAIVADGNLTSIGQLGDIFDPARVTGDSSDIKLSRGGGRTMKIGQPDDLAGTRFSPTWFNSAWRLTDIFSADLGRDVTNNLITTSPPTSGGKLNINGVLRDSGVAFRAALRSFSFLAAPNSDPQLNGKPLSDAEATALISDITTYLTNNGPFMERGEISQLPFFKNGTPAGASLATVNDRGREEIFRRTIETVTTRSAAFTVYAVGQAIRQDKNGVKTSVGQTRLAITFQLEPQVSGAPLQNSSKSFDIANGYKAKRIYAPN